MPLLAVAITAGPLFAQLQFEELGKRHVPPSRTLLVGAAFEDFDGDGDRDLFVAGGRNGFLSPSRLYANDGSGVFAEVPFPLPPQPGTDGIEAVVAVDVDCDGDLDLVLANSSLFGSLQDRLWLNSGTGTFVDATASRLPIDSDETLAVVAGDVNGDGYPDLLFGGFNAPVRLYLNDRSGSFVDATANLPALTADTRGLVLLDADGDDDLDLACANGHQTGQKNWLWQNDGAGVFTDVTATNLPSAVDKTTSVVAGDLDGDGDQDLVFADRHGAVVYLNQGGATFAAAAAPLPFLPSAEALVLADLDGDRDLDLVAAVYGQDRLLLNSGAGTFTEVTASNMPDVREFNYNILAGDADGDGDRDLVCIGVLKPTRLFFNDGNAAFRDGNASPLPIALGALGMAAGDLDADGDTDLVMATLHGVLLLRNDGHGWFTQVPSAVVAWDANGVAIADFDGDGRLDLAFACDNWFPGATNRLWLNRGAWTFTDASAQLPVALGEHTAVAAGDVDGDGDEDLVFAVGPYQSSNTGQSLLWLNSGAATFTDVTATHLPQQQDNSRGVALEDLDGDGDRDLVFANWQRQNRFWCNDGTGRFTDVTAQLMPVDTAESSSVAVGDVDGDGDRDLVFANGAASSQQSTLYRNDGTGAFTDVTATNLPARSRYSAAVVLADVDNDGDRDLVFGNGFNVRRVQNELWLNDGTGTFVDATNRLPSHLDATQALLAADLDGDEDLDLVFSDSSFAPGGERICFNLLRQIDSPLTLRPGYHFRLELSSRTSPVNQVDYALPFLSLGAARVPFAPLGTFGLDPTQMVQLPPVSIQGPTRTRSLVLRLPPNPSLVGMRLWSQALLLQSPWLHLTNVAADQVIR